jgi:NodT family efflux transporter outer membrane factor (OMF) lipoprotein
LTRMAHRRAAQASLAAIALALGGCAVGPNFHTPAPPSADRYTPAPLPAETSSAATHGGAVQKLVRGAAVDGRWWTLFGSPQLNALEDEALAANPDLAAAKAALRQARESYLADRAALFPTIGLTANGARAKDSLTIAPTLTNNSEYYTLYQGQLTLTYVVDVFGGVRRQIESSAAQAESQRFQTEAAYLTLTTNVANAAVQLAGLEAQLDATDRIIAANRQTLEITRSERELGQAAEADLAAAQAALEQAEQLAPPLRKQIAQQRDLLAALLGRPSSQAPEARLDLASFTLPAELPVSLPSELVRQRPDVRAAEANLHAAYAQVGVAVAARLPSLTINGAAGGASSEISSLLTNGNSLWSIEGGVAQTVFDAGALRHRQKAAEAALDQARAQYKSAVLASLQNTADVLQSIVEDANALQHASAARDAALKSLKIAQSELEHGQIATLNVLTAQAAYQQSELALAQARAARFADTVALFQALGGGWWNRSGPTAP